MRKTVLSINIVGTTEHLDIAKPTKKERMEGKAERRKEEMKGGRMEGVQLYHTLYVKFNLK